MDRASLAARIQEILKSRPGRPNPVGQASALVQSPIDEGSEAGSTINLDSTDESAAFARRCAAAEASSRVLEILGATLVDHETGACIVVDRHYPLTHVHGRHSIERFRTAAGHSRCALPWFLRERNAEATSALPASRDANSASGLFSTGEQSLLFFDLETTGLSGGAGTYAFLVGFGFFDEEGFSTRQFFLRGFGDERALLHAVTRELAGRRDATGRRDACLTEQVPVLVSFNGKSFDVPLIETRYQFNRLRSPFEDVPHVDMLFPARRLWKRRHDHGMRWDVPRVGRPAVPPGAGVPGLGGAGVSRLRGAGVSPASFGDSDAAPGSCALTALERDILGLCRDDDVPGWEIPTRYFGYARTGDASGLAAVLEHNRLDLISLGAIAAVILEMAAEGASAVRERPDCLALGRLLESLGRIEEAERCFCAAAEPDGMLDSAIDRLVRAEALHWLALHRRRAHRFGDAAQAWQQLVEIPGLDSDRKREALEALAIHHEHRAKDLGAARAFAMSALQLSSDARRVDEVRHRLGRLSRKMGQEPDDPPPATMSLLPEAGS